MRNKTLDLNGMTRLNNYLIEVLELLGDERLANTELEQEVRRAKAIYDLAVQLIANYAVRSNAYDGSLTGKLLAALEILIAKREQEIKNDGSRLESVRNMLKQLLAQEW